MMACQICVPTCPEEITASWLSDILGCPINEQNVILEKAEEGMLRFCVRIKCEKIADEEPKRYELLAKFLPESFGNNTDNRYIIWSQKLDKIEMQFYRHIVPDLLEISPRLEKYFSLNEYVYGCWQDAPSSGDYSSILVLEDLKAEGYEQLDFIDYDESKIMMGLEFLADFHSGCLRLKEKQSQSMKEIYDFLPNTAKHSSSLQKKDKVLHQRFSNCLNDLSKILDNEENEFSEDLIDNYVQLMSLADEIFSLVLGFEGRGTLINGNMRIEHIFGKQQNNWNTFGLENRSDTLPSVKVRDWQALRCGDPIYDLSTFLLTCLPVDEITPSRIEHCLFTYFSSFSKQVGEWFNMDVNYDKFCDEFQTYGLSYAFIFFTMEIGNFPFRKERFQKVLRYFCDAGVPEFLIWWVMSSDEKVNALEVLIPTEPQYNRGLENEERAKGQLQLY